MVCWALYVATCYQLNGKKEVNVLWYFLKNFYRNFISKSTGLPHQHMLVWLDIEISPRNIDSIICAELPDPDKDPELFKLVKAWMLHG